VIGVTLKLYETIIVSEFFELFKTPWEVVKQEGIYDVIICDHAESEIFQARLVIIIHRNEGTVFNNRGNTPPQDPLLLQSGKTNFPVYTGIRNIKNGSPLIIVEKTGECIGSSFDEENKTILHIGYDFFEETCYLLTNGQPLEYAGFPTLDIHINNLRTWILAAGIPLIEIPPIAHSSKFFACLTHDVDFAGIRNYKFDLTLFGFVYRALIKSAIQYLKGQYSLKMLARNWLAVVELPLIYMGLLRDFWSTFRQYREIEGRAPSTFFFVPFKNRPGKSEVGTVPFIRAVKYDVTNLSKEILDLMAQGCEIGVHGIDSWVDVDSAREEIGRIQDLIGQSELGVRMHWLYFGTESPAKLEKAGYVFDSTCGYNEQIGYKAGTSQVYRPLGAKRLLELPMHIMDTALFYPDRMNLTFSEGITAIKTFIETATRFGGVLTFNWHDRSIAPERLWDEVYRCALNKLRLHGALFMTAGALVDWFKKRRAIVFSSVFNNGSSIKVKLTGTHVCSVDGMILRIYPPSKRASGDISDASTTAAYCDYWLTDLKKEVDFIF